MMCLDWLVHVDCGYVVHIPSSDWFWSEVFRQGLDLRRSDIASDRRFPDVICCQIVKCEESIQGGAPPL